MTMCSSRWEHQGSSPDRSKLDISRPGNSAARSSGPSTCPACSGRCSTRGVVEAGLTTAQALDILSHGGHSLNCPTWLAAHALLSAGLDEH